MDMSQGPLCAEICGKNVALQDRGASQVSCEPAQESCHAGIHRKMPRPRTATQVLCEPARSKRLGPQSEHLHQAPALTNTVGALSVCTHTAWGMKCLLGFPTAASHWEPAGGVSVVVVFNDVQDLHTVPTLIASSISMLPLVPRRNQTFFWALRHVFFFKNCHGFGTWKLLFSCF